MGRVDDVPLGHLDPGPLAHPIDHLARLAVQVVGHRDRPLRGVDVEREVIETTPGNVADPADLLLGRGPRDGVRVGVLAGQNPWCKPDGVGLACGQLERRASPAADEERNVRPLDRLRIPVVVGDPVVLAHEREWLGAEAALDHRDRFREPRLADADRIERQADCRVLGLVPAGTDRDVQPTARKHVERCQILGKDRRMAQVVVVHEGADPHPLGQRRDRREIGHGRELRDQMVGQDVGRDAQVLGSPSAIPELARGGRIEGIGEEGERLHRDPKPSGLSTGGAVVRLRVPRRPPTRAAPGGSAGYEPARLRAGPSATRRQMRRCIRRADPTAGSGRRPRSGTARPRRHTTRGPRPGR